MRLAVGEREDVSGDMKGKGVGSGMGRRQRRTHLHSIHSQNQVHIIDMFEAVVHQLI